MSSSLESCCCGRSYFAIKLEHISTVGPTAGTSLWEEKLVARFTRCLISGLMCAASWRNVCRWIEEKRLVCRHDIGDCTIHPFVMHRPHRYAHQSESVRKIGSERTKSNREEECGTACTAKAEHKSSPRNSHSSWSVKCHVAWLRLIPSKLISSVLFLVKDKSMDRKR